ncbi:MAG: hypothetical protein U0792_11280 [Gemmataceae bacterium]
MIGNSLKFAAIALAGLVCLLRAAPSAVGDDSPDKAAGQPPAPEAARFSREFIPPIEVTSDGHVSTVKNGVKFDVYFNKGPKLNAAIYAINTDRKQLVLTPKQHTAILEDLLRRKFTVIVADFKDKKLAGLELEKYVVKLTADAREAADGVLLPAGVTPPKQPMSKTDTFASDYFTLMPGFTVERDVTWFRYGDIPVAFRQEIAQQLEKPFNKADADKVNTYDIVHPVYGPAVGVLTNYASNEKGREHYYPLENRYLVQAFAFKNLAIVHQQYFNDPVGGYPKGYSYYGDQFAVCFIQHLKGNADRYHIDTKKICCFGHSKGSEVPGMLVNKLRATPQFLYGKADFKKISLGEMDKTIPSPHAKLSTEIACAILGAGVANNEMLSGKMLPWDNEPAKNISPFFLFADHNELIRKRTRDVVAKAKAHGVTVETVELNSHTWPFADAYDQASAFADRILKPDY